MTIPAVYPENLMPRHKKSNIRHEHPLQGAPFLMPSHKTSNVKHDITCCSSNPKSHKHSKLAFDERNILGYA